MLLRPFSFARSTTRSTMQALRPYSTGQPKTLQFQKDLARLPVPSLPASLERYVKSLKPILLERALKAGKSVESVEAELAQRDEWAKDFGKQGGLGKVLQERLKGE